MKKIVLYLTIIFLFAVASFPAAVMAGEAAMAENAFDNSTVTERILETLGNNDFADTYQSLASGMVIENGSVGDAVTGLQELLIAMGEPIEADGSAGGLTIKALNHVQAHCGLEKTDYVDAQVFESLLKCLLVYSDIESASRILGEAVNDYRMSVYDNYDGINELYPDSYLDAVFIDVGQGDAAVIICDGEAMMIDGGESSSSDRIYSLLRSYDINHLKYIICSHPQEDHAGGLAGALNYATAEKAYCSSLKSGGEGFDNFVRYLNQQGVQLEVPEPGTQFSLGCASAKIIGPVGNAENENDSSLIVKIKYGDTSFLFTGDAEEKEEMDLVKSGEDLSCTVLKVAHHGSGTSSTPAFLKEASPVYGIVSCGAFNSYGHPADDTLNRLSGQGVQLLRTDIQGNITLHSDGSNIEVSTERNPYADTYATYYSLYVEPETTYDLSRSLTVGDSDYIVNIRSGKFHYPSCDSVRDMKEDNKWYYNGTAEELVDMGYVPCKNCHPHADNYQEQAAIQQTTAAVRSIDPISVQGTDYVVNTNTGKFHNPGCSSVKKMKESNKWFYNGTRDELLSMGYSPCGNCHP